MTPGEMLDDRKMKKLQNLEADQKALLRADDENMTRDGSSGARTPAEKIRSIQHAERKLKRAQGTEEENILNELIEVNLAAGSFYHQAADQIRTSRAENTFHDLEQIHGDIVAGLGLAAYRNGNTKIYKPITNSKKHDIFSDLRKSLPTEIDLNLVSAVEDAENNCVSIMEQALVSDKISMDVKMHVHEAVMMLQERHKHIHWLKRTMLAPEKELERF